MSTDTDTGVDLDRTFAAAKAVAETVCYEGYVLYPYRASAGKNRLRWQFGVLAPPSATGERSSARAELVVDARAGARLHVRLRALQVQQRQVEAAEGADFVPVPQIDDGEAVWASFDEAVEYERDLTGLDVCAAGAVELAFELPESRSSEPIVDAGGATRGRLVRRTWPIRGLLRVTVSPLAGPYSLTRVTLEIANATDWAEPADTRDEVTRRSLVAAHLLAAVEGGACISSLDPPRFAAEAVAGCHNDGLFPVLVGRGDDDDVMLASPIILYDHPALAPESEGDMFDATEIDEILALRVRTLTDDEKREARGTDPRSAAIIDRCDAMGEEALGALHGTFRSIRPLRPEADLDDAPWWEPQVDAAFDPWTDTIDIAGVTVGAGSRVRLQPTRRSDAQDLFIAGKTAAVTGVFHDVSGEIYLAVAVDDPDSDLHQWHGRYLYFHPDEVELLDPPAPTSPPALESRPRVLVAGVGNIFLSDDGFGVEVARQLDPSAFPDGVKVADFGIRGVHLAYELLDGYDVLVLIDAVSRGDPPGTVSIIEHAAGDTEGTLAAMDAHGMDPAAVLAMAGDLGAKVDQVLVVACEVADIQEAIGLSPEVAAAVPGALAAVQDLVAELLRSPRLNHDPLRHDPKEALP